MPTVTPDDFARFYNYFTASVSRYDCGRKCAPLNGGTPVCCSTEHAVPIVDRPEWQLLKSRTDLWRRFKPYDAPTRALVEEISSQCVAIECKGARFCERDNRSLGCRSFPFFPYITREREVIGLATYWTFADRCWLMSNLQIVEQDFIDQILAVHEDLFARDPKEFDVFLQQSASARRVFSRWRRPLPVLGRDGRLLLVGPGARGIREAGPRDWPRSGPFVSERAYRQAVKAAGGSLPASGLQPE